MNREMIHWRGAGFLVAAVVLAGCANHGSIATPPVAAAGQDDVPADHPIEPTGEDAVGYYIGRLADRSFIRTYGDRDNPRVWYTAAEALGEIGKPAIPALIERLATDDPYELKLALYALMLASQDPVLGTATGGDYLRLGTVLTEGSNEENLRLAQAWWQRHRHLWP